MRTTKLPDKAIDDDHKHNANVYHSGASSTSCPCCEQNHPIYKCSKIKQFSVAERRRLFRVKNLCFICLRSGRNLRSCRLNKRCFSCHNKRKSHHSMLLEANQQPQTTSPLSAHAGALGSTILPTIMLPIETSCKNNAYYRALLDCGSQISLVSEPCAQ